VQIRKERVLLDVKTDRRPRGLPLSEIAVEALRLHRDRQAFERKMLGQGWRHQGPVLASTSGTPLDPDSVAHRFQRFHDVRHACASLMLASANSELDEGCPPRDSNPEPSD
jgi:integrase